jgi:hypothetical protein
MAASAMRESWSHERVIAEIRARHEQGLPLAGVREQSPKLADAAKRFFGSWHAALLAAGLSAEPFRKWSRQRVLETIQERSRQGPVTATILLKDKLLSAAVYRYFGNWQRAMEAAGLPIKRRQRWTKEAVLQALKDWHRRVGPGRHRVEPRLAVAAWKFFRGLRRAREAAGLEPNNPLWTKQRVIQAIQDHHVRGLPLRPRSFPNPSLVAAARRYFGSWQQAVTAAGLASQLPKRQPRRTWTRQKVLQAIRDWHEKGRPLKAVAQEDKGLHFQACKYFGSWREALAAVGLTPPAPRWTHKRVVEAIRIWHVQGVPPGRISGQDSRLFRAGVRLFGRWSKALEAAGLVSKRKAGSHG